MVYEKNMLKVISQSIIDRYLSLGEDEDRKCDLDDEYGFGPLTKAVEGKSPVVFLPHSCDEWVIGDETNVRQLIKDVENALVRMKE